MAVNGAPVVSFTDRERPHPAGSVGVYTEDARAEFRDIVIVRPET